MRAIYKNSVFFELYFLRTTSGGGGEDGGGDFL
jgi:hypothetical protein